MSMLWLVHTHNNLYVYEYDYLWILMFHDCSSSFARCRRLYVLQMTELFCMSCLFRNRLCSQMKFFSHAHTLSSHCEYTCNTFVDILLSISWNFDFSIFDVGCFVACFDLSSAMESSSVLPNNFARAAPSLVLHVYCSSGVCGGVGFGFRAELSLRTFLLGIWAL